jgi:hypothetical protein
MNAAGDNKKRAVAHARTKGPKPNGSAGSKYAKKNNGKKFKKPVPKLKRGAPVFLYFVQGTDIQATKVPCERTAEDRAERKFSQSTLGTWRDPRNNRKCKVDRVRNKPEVAEAA